ncbi:hypothetical protein JAAARDRAFT_551472 [Jaapia argillacea MUCL 33604]|uniref:Uncharacterized protein n=1 Tax=Jaapia argillacea MUCL 33604 TaxID=933084 RepID=A0A067P773_9AGAM|nr:hypothetical protein JAAARDRAFT_551472 [Jaapia argillacea MUCL 33604]
MPWNNYAWRAIRRQEKGEIGEVWRAHVDFQNDLGPQASVAPGSWLEICLTVVFERQVTSAILRPVFGECETDAETGEPIRDEGTGIDGWKNHMTPSHQEGLHGKLPRADALAGGRPCPLRGEGSGSLSTVTYKTRAKPSRSDHVQIRLP